MSETKYKSDVLKRLPPPQKESKLKAFVTWFLALLFSLTSC